MYETELIINCRNSGGRDGSPYLSMALNTELGIDSIPNHYN